MEAHRFGEFLDLSFYAVGPKDFRSLRVNRQPNILVEWMLGIKMINEALRLIRVFHDLKQFELAERMKVSKSHISEIESGTKTPSLELIEKYSAEFRIPVSAIMFFAEELPAAKRGEKARTKIASSVLDLLGFIERKADASAA